MDKTRFGGRVSVYSHDIPETGREWKYTATPEQAETIRACEDLIRSMQDENYGYWFRESHKNFKGREFDGWTLTVANVKTGKNTWNRYSGIPGSPHHVLSEAHRLLDRLREKEAAAANA